MPTDPQNAEAYRYVVDSIHTFELCATFERDSNGEPQPTDGYSVPVPASLNVTARNSIGNNWQHGAGQVCFIRTIDPALYPVNTTSPKVAK